MKLYFIEERGPRSTVKPVYGRGESRKRKESGKLVAAISRHGLAKCFGVAH